MMPGSYCVVMVPLRPDGTSGHEQGQETIALSSAATLGARIVASVPLGNDGSPDVIRVDRPRPSDLTRGYAVAKVCKRTARQRGRGGGRGAGLFFRHRRSLLPHSACRNRFHTRARERNRRPKVDDYAKVPYNNE